jgi:hypothetical protein
MHADDLAQLARILSLSITPVALISGVGLLLLSMTNRLGRIIDRSRVLAAAEAAEESREEMRILLRRARTMLLSIAFIATSIFLAALMVVTLFAMHFLVADLGTLILLLFGGCLASLVASIAFFLIDIFISIRWLRVSLGRAAAGDR